MYVTSGSLLDELVKALEPCVNFPQVRTAATKFAQKYNDNPRLIEELSSGLLTYIDHDFIPSQKRWNRVSLMRLSNLSYAAGIFLTKAEKLSQTADVEA